MTTPYVPVVIRLACGSGWVEVGLLTAAIVLAVFAVLGRADACITRVSRGFDLYAEVVDYEDVPRLLAALHEHNVQFSGLQVSKSPVGTAIVQLSATTQHLGEKESLSKDLRALDCVRYVELF